MDFNGFYEEYGMPFSGRKRQKLIQFLNEADLDYDEQIEYTVNLVDGDGTIVATGSVQSNVLKCIAVSDKHQGLGLSARIITCLMNYASEKGHHHLFLFTKPKNKFMFSELGFYKIIENKDVLLMENKRNGIQAYVGGLERPENNSGVIGAIIANCNPFTNGHRYLIEQASKQCDTLHLFVLSEDRSVFSTDVRYRLVQEGVKDLTNVILHHTSDYLISSAVFPTYFIKDKKQAADANCELDVRIFCEFFAKELGITKRFVGTEPFCPVTSGYNQQMKKVFPEYGIELVEIQRKEMEETPISASFVRKCMAEKDYETIKKIVPQSTYDYIISDEGKSLL
jgi:[citrate (pro-3S)-lyase] ligase